jgi:uncharacterized protein (DUF2236 family)
LDAAIARHTADGLDRDLFPRGESALRGVYEAGLNALVYGQVGLVEGGMSAGHVAGTFDHTRDREKPFERLVSTAIAFHTMITGSRRQAIAVAEGVHRGHTWVKGHFREAAGPYPAGTPYSAHDLAMMKWTGVSVVRGLTAVDEVTHGQLAEDRRDAVCHDGATLIELFGLPREAFPQTYQELKAYDEQAQTSGELHLTQTGRYFGEEILLRLPLPLLAELFRHLVMNPLERAALREETRESYGIRYNRLDSLRAETAAFIARGIGAITPDLLRVKLVPRAFEQVRAAEAASIRRHRPHPVVPENPYV